MSVYYKDEEKKERWESGQAILHRQQQETKKDSREDKDYELKNSYGTLHYLKRDKKNRREKEGLAIEAFEAPGTPVHTEKEKHIDRASMKRVCRGEKKSLFSSELPLRNQALFYDMSDRKKSDAFLKCMKELLRRQGHRTLRDAFGFLDQEPERLELETLKSRQKNILPEDKTEHQQELTLQEFASTNKRIDSLNSRLHKKEAKERQLCSELQTMLAQRTKDKPAKERRFPDRPVYALEEQEKQTAPGNGLEEDNDEITEAEAENSY